MLLGCRAILPAPPGLPWTQMLAHLHPLSFSHSLEASWGCCDTCISACSYLSFVTLAFQHVVTCPLLPLEVPNPITTQSWSAVTGQHCLPECEINGTEEINSRVNSISWSIHSMQAVLELSLVEDKSVCIESTVMIHYMIYYMIQWFISICSTF